MNTWITHDGKSFKAPNDIEFLEQLRSDTIVKTNDIFEFMRMMQYWTLVYCKVSLDTSSVSAFIDSLIKHNLVWKMEE